MLHINSSEILGHKEECFGAYEEKFKSTGKDNPSFSSVRKTVFVLGQSVLQGAQSSAFCFSAAGSQTHGGAMSLAVTQTTSVLKEIRYSEVCISFPILLVLYIFYEIYSIYIYIYMAYLVAQLVKNLPAMQETWV